MENEITPTIQATPASQQNAQSAKPQSDDDSAMYQSRRQAALDPGDADDVNSRFLSSIPRRPSFFDF